MEGGLSPMSDSNWRLVLAMLLSIATGFRWFALA